MQVLFLCTIGQVSEHCHVLHKPLSGSVQVSCHAPLVIHLPLLVCEEGAPILSHYPQALVQVKEEGEVALEPCFVGYEAVADALQ